MGTCFNDTCNIPVTFHIRYNRLIKCGKIIAVFAPDISESLGLRMKKCIARYDFFPIAQLSVFVKTHPELFVLIDGFHNDIKHHRKETEPLGFLLRYKVCDVKVCVQVVLTFDLGIIVIEINASYPCGFVYRMKLGIHILFFFAKVRESLLS